MLSLFCEISFAQSNDVMVVRQADGSEVEYDVTNVEKVYIKTVDPTPEPDLGYVDLGLPSGTLWATCNLGTDKPEGYGNYYAWGETVTNSNYSSSTSKWHGASVSSLTSQGVIDADGNLVAKYDAATQILGGDWRMPTLAEQDELRTKCTWVWTKNNGINGYVITGPNGKSIFLPAAGGIGGYYKGNVGTNCDYWSSTIYSNTEYAYDLNFSSSSVTRDWGYRYSGECIRPVYAPTSEPEYVDLGLPSGLKWATCNLGASKPEEYGDYSAWGENVTKRNYSSTTSEWYGVSVGNLTSQGVIDADGNLTAQYDAATQILGSDWRIPTLTEQDELRAKCTWIWTKKNGINGYVVTGPNGNSIFLPAAGGIGGYYKGNVGTACDYWSSTVYDNTGYAYDINISSGSYIRDWGYRYSGESIRPVLK